jgi:hypothetical protein
MIEEKSNGEKSSGLYFYAQMWESEAGQLIKGWRQVCLQCPWLLAIKILTMTTVVPSLWSILVA